MIDIAAKIVSALDELTDIAARVSRAIDSAVVPLNRVNAVGTQLGQLGRAIAAVVQNRFGFLGDVVRRFGEAIARVGIWIEGLIDRLRRSSLGVAIDQTIEAVKQFIAGLDAAKRAVEATDQALKRAEESFKAVQTAGDAIAEAIKNPTWQNLRKAYEAVEDAIDSVTASIEAVTQAIGSIEQAVDAFEKSYEAARNALDAIGRIFGGVFDWFKNKLATVMAAFQKGSLNGLVAVLAEFNPVALVAEAIDGLMNVALGIDLSKLFRNLLGRVGAVAEELWSELKEEGVTDVLNAGIGILNTSPISDVLGSVGVNMPIPAIPFASMPGNAPLIAFAPEPNGPFAGGAFDGYGRTDVNVTLRVEGDGRVVRAETRDFGSASSHLDVGYSSLSHRMA